VPRRASTYDERLEFNRVIAAEPWSFEHMPLHGSARDAPLRLRNPLTRADRGVAKRVEMGHLSAFLTHLPFIGGDFSRRSLPDDNG
jgi:hypothetical protein